jgi:hypothetical protein
MTAPRPSGPTPRVPRRWPTFNCAFALSPSVRLAQVYGVSRAKGAMELYRRSCQRVAQGNEVLRSYGLLALVIQNMAQIDASLSSDVIPPLSDAVHQCELADCQEELTDAMLRRAIEEGTLTIEQAQASIKASALKRHRAEIKERALGKWIEEQKK